MKWEAISYYLLKTFEIELACNYHDAQLPLFQLHAEKRKNAQEKENYSVEISDERTIMRETLMITRSDLATLCLPAPPAHINCTHSND